MPDLSQHTPPSQTNGAESSRMYVKPAHANPSCADVHRSHASAHRSTVDVDNIFRSSKLYDVEHIILYFPPPDAVYAELLSHPGALLEVAPDNANAEL